MVQDKPMSLIFKHANTQFTHLRLIYSLFKMTRRVLCTVTRTSVFKTRQYERDSLSRNRCEWQCIAIVILMLTIPWVISKIENCRNVNLASLWSLQVVIMMTTWVMTMLASWRLSVFSAMPHQILDQYSLIPLYYLWWSDILHHSEPLSKCDMNNYFTLVTKLNNIVVNDCNIL